MVDMSNIKKTKVVWEQPRYVFIAMNVLARNSGVIFANGGEWDGRSATEGAMYNFMAVDSFNGRVIWRIPIGSGGTFCHEYGGIYFDRNGDKIYMGTNNYHISIQNVEDAK